MGGDWDRDWYPPARPKKPKHGIAAKSQRGAFGGSWWAQRWIKALEAFGWANRLQRGRNYARAGQVVSIELGRAEVKAGVQGSRPAPYKVSIRLKPLSDKQWEQTIEAIAGQAIFAAKLLAGEMPPDIETAFDTAGVPLFPVDQRDFDTRCSCPDAANPCKHIAAVYYLLGEQFDEDPFVLFELRGRTREQIAAALRARRAAAAEQAPRPKRARAEAPPADAVPPLSSRLDSFYAAGADLDAITVEVKVPQVECMVLRQLGPAPGGLGAEVEAIYREVSRAVIEKVLGE